MDRLKEIHDVAPCTCWSTVKRCSQVNTVTSNYFWSDPSLLKKKKRDWHNHIPAWSVLLLYSEIRQWNKPPPLPFLCISLGCYNSATWPNHTVRCCYLGYLISTKLFLFYIGFNKPFVKEFLHHLLILQLYLWKASCKNCNQDFLFF